MSLLAFACSWASIRILSASPCASIRFFSASPRAISALRCASCFAFSFCCSAMVTSCFAICTRSICSLIFVGRLMVLSSTEVRMTGFSGSSWTLCLIFVSIAAAISLRISGSCSAVYCPTTSRTTSRTLELMIFSSQLVPHFSMVFGAVSARRRYWTARSILTVRPRLSRTVMAGLRLSPPS